MTLQEQLSQGGFATELCDMLQVFSALQGHRPLPWEGDQREIAHKALGILSGPVLQLLQREPSRRPSLRRFHEACTKAFTLAQNSGSLAR